MSQNRKSLEEQLAEARLKKQQAAARLEQLEVRRKVRDARTRAWGEKILVGVLLQTAAAQQSAKDFLERVVTNAELKPKEREAALWVLDRVGSVITSADNGVSFEPATHTGEAGQAAGLRPNGFAGSL